MRKPGLRIFFLAILLVIFFPPTLSSQYFGRNKPGYRIFKYDAIHTPNFEIYHYLNNDTLVNQFSEWAEEWFNIHQGIFRDTFLHKNPLILYSHHSDFQQTTAVGGIIGTTTGGVTESLKNRVVMPMAPTLAQTDHVLGHELVHAFQFNRLLHIDSIKGSMLNNIPLWMIEGMAEYFSIGSVDPNTAMWMRDALMNDDFPTLKKLSTESRYFPYRYGHAFWAMIGKTWGDSLILPLFMHTARFGLDKALDSLLGFDSKVLSGLWKNAMETYYGKYLKDTLSQEVVGKKVISSKNSGRMNLSPSLSPDGKFLAFFSEKDVFSLDLYLASAESGKIIKKLSSVTRQHDIDDFSFNESAGTWSPDSKKFAFVIFQKGRNKLAVVDVKRAKIVEEIEFGSIVSFSNPEWSPDGSTIAFSGLVEGLGDIYLYHLNTQKLTKLTGGFSSKIHPSWSPDGNYIVYCDEVFNTDRNAKKFSVRLKVIDLRTKAIKELDVFPGADNLNPRFSHDGKNIYFLSNSDGFRNLYAYNLDFEKVFQLSRFKTGISGLTPFSPAMDAAIGSDLVAFTLYNNNNYEIYAASSADFLNEEVCSSHVDFTPGTLPPLNHYYSNMVDTILYTRWSRSTKLSPDSIKQVPYKAKFKLDYISNTAGIGVSTSRYNTSNMAGSVSMIFSDMVGNNQLYSILALNGEIYDFGGQVAYLNQTRKFKWGISASHIPYRFGDMFFRRDTLKFNSDEDKEVKLPVTDVVLDFIRMFEDNVSFYTFQALSQTRRIEAGASAAWYYYRIDRYHSYYDDWGYPVAYSKERREAPNGNNYQMINIAYVTDNSFFGMTSPMRGGRARYQIEKYFGAVDFFTGLIDYRKYHFINPFTFAYRIYHYGRYGSGSDTDLISPIYLGYPWLIRGYDNQSFYGNRSDNIIGYSSINYSHLSGSRVVVANVELRCPLTGPKMLALFRSKYFMTDINLFFDGGLAWSKGDKPKLIWEPEAFNQRVPVFSTGASIRLNLLGALILETYFAIPFQNGGWQNRNFGVNFIPGW